MMCTFVVYALPVYFDGNTCMMFGAMLAASDPVSVLTSMIGDRRGLQAESRSGHATEVSFLSRLSTGRSSRTGSFTLEDSCCPPLTTRSLLRYFCDSLFDSTLVLKRCRIVLARTGRQLFVLQEVLVLVYALCHTHLSVSALVAPTRHPMDYNARAVGVHSQSSNVEAVGRLANVQSVKARRGSRGSSV